MAAWPVLLPRCLAHLFRRALAAARSVQEGSGASHEPRRACVQDRTAAIVAGRCRKTSRYDVRDAARSSGDAEKGTSRMRHLLMLAAEGGGETGFVAAIK